MSIGDRIKNVRGELRQDAFADKIGVHLNTVGRWERGQRIPDVDDLNKILTVYPNISPTWLLTGKGMMWIFTASEFWSEKFKEMRGDLTIPEFVEKFKFVDKVGTIAGIQAVENKELGPDALLLTLLSEGTGISLDWLLGWQDAPKIRLGSALNINLLKDIIKEAELHDSINPGSLSPDKKAELIAELYAMRA